MNQHTFNTIIVGGGIAGLTSAVYLARAGIDVLLIEKNDQFGGLVNSFIVDGFHFEAGLRALESAGIILPMLEDLGIEIEFVKSKVSIGIEEEILNIEDFDSIIEYQHLLEKIYPDSKNEIDDFIKIMRKIMKQVDILYGIENPLFKDLKKDKEYIFKKLLPWLPKFIFTVGKINRLNTPVEEYLKEIIKDQSLRDIISQHFFKGTPAFFALSYFSLYLDYFYPKKGVGILSESIKEKIIEYNGSLKPNTFIKEVYAESQYIVDQDNNKYFYQHLIWAADLKTFYNSTHLENLRSDIKAKFDANLKVISGSKGSESVFTLFLEVDLPLSYFKNIAHGHFFYTPSKKGLAEIHRSELEGILKNWSGTSKTDIIKWFKKFLNLNTFEISIPGLKNSKLSPKDKTGVIISFLIDFELFSKMKNSGWYDEIRELIENELIKILSASVYPDLKENIIKKFSFTPLSIKNRVASSDGAIVGWTFEKPLPVLNKINKADKSVLTPIPNIYQIGQWAYSPAGVPMSILTGKIAANKVLKRTKN